MQEKIISNRKECNICSVISFATIGFKVNKGKAVNEIKPAPRNIRRNGARRR